MKLLDLLENMITKKIHYCWFGRGKMPSLAEKCINSWKRYLPDYEIKRWDESNFDVYAIPYTRDAYLNKKYAFVSDYVRFYALYNEGGCYFDVDVEIIRDFTPILSRGPYFGIETGIMVAPGLGMAAEAKMPFLLECLEYYSNLSFYRKDGSLNYDTVVFHITSLLKEKGLKPSDDIQYVAGFYIYPKSYFAPIDYETKKINITSDTYSIHHYLGSWVDLRHRLYTYVKKKISGGFAKKCSDIYYFFFKRR